MNESTLLAEHAPIFWPLMVTALGGLVAIVVATIVSVGYIRREAREAAEGAAIHMADAITKKLEVYMAQTNSWRESMEDWKRSFHDSIKAMREDIRNVISRQAVLEEVARRGEHVGRELEKKMAAMEKERAARHERELKLEESKP